jgi:hypothetical protein
MTYATTDSKVLLMLWSYLKSNTNINKISLNRSKDVILIKYQFPVRKNCWIDDLANFMTHMKCENASIKSVIIDELNDRKELFRLLWLTRDECSRIVDRRSNVFMTIDELGYISIPASNCRNFNVAPSKYQTVGYFNCSEKSFMHS